MLLSIPSIRPASWLPFAACALSLLAAEVARAEAPVLLWGFQSGCEQLTNENRAVEKALHAQQKDVGLLGSPRGTPLPACVGERCAQALRAACPAASGRLLGGQVVSSRNVVKTRLWLHDLASGQTAYQDEYCQSCDLGLATALTAQARHLIEQPHFGAAPGPTPTYCAGPAARQDGAQGEQRGGPVFLTVYGDSRHKAPLHEALRQQLGLRGRQVLQVTVESKTYAREELEKIVAGHSDAQVLGVNVPRDGKLQIFLFDQRSGKSDFKSVGCPECAQDKDTMIAKVQPEVAAMLEHCFGWQCADPAARPPGAEPPLEACEPFPAPSCSDLDALLAPAAGDHLDQDHLTPRTAKLIKASVWSLFAASAAAAIGLGIANSLVTQEANGHTYSGSLTQPAWAVAGVSAGIFAVALPVTILVNRAQRSSASAASSGSSLASTIQCPN